MPPSKRPWRGRATAAAVLAAVTLVASGCLARPQHFEALGTTPGPWIAEINDLTGSLVAARAEPRPDEAGLASSRVRLRNLAPDTIEVGWLANACLSSTFFSLVTERDGIELRFDLGGPCAAGDVAASIAPAGRPDPGSSAAPPALVPYAIELRFSRPMPVASVTAVAPSTP